MKVLVTGANGFVGKNLCAYLLKNGFEFLRTDVGNSDIDGDLTDRSFVIDSLRRIEFDSIVHLAALANIPKSLEDPSGCYRVNCFGTLNLLELAAVKRLNRFVYTSSNNVYGPPKRLPVREDDSYNPRSPYDYSKVVAEQFVKSFHLHKRIPTVVLRSWNMFGPHDVSGRAVPRFIAACISDQPIPLYNGGRDSDDFYYVENYCKAVTVALTNPKAVGEVFNVGTGGNVTVRDLAEMVKQLTGSTSKLEILPPRTELEKKPRKTRPSIHKVRRVLGYRPVVLLKEGLERTIQWYMKKSTA